MKRIFTATALVAGGILAYGSGASAATWELIFTSNGAPPPGVNACSGDFGTDPNCIYVSEDDFYYDDDPSLSAALSSYDSNDYGALDQIEKFDDPFSISDPSFSFDSNGDLSWTYDPGASEWVIFAFAVKGGQGYNLYEISSADEPKFSGFLQSASGWASLQGSDVDDISNVVFFGKELAPIPLPAAGWMLLAGLGGLVAMKRRKKADA